MILGLSVGRLTRRTGQVADPLMDGSSREAGRIRPEARTNPAGGGRAFLRITITGVAVAGLAATGPTLGQSSEGTAGEGVRAGWSLYTSDAPAFSIQLPSGWVVDPAAEGLLVATGPNGESLALRLDESVAGEPLEGYTKRSWRSVEKDVEALLADGKDIAGGTPTEPTYRQAAHGPVARLGVARSVDEVSDDSHVTARFLTAPCLDGARTLELTGPAPEPGPDGGPDAWDSIAASVSPCSSEPMPELVLGPEVDALRAAYLAVSEEVNPRLLAAVDELFSGGTFKKWAKDSRSVADVYDEFVQLLSGTPVDRRDASAVGGSGRQLPRDGGLLPHAAGEGHDEPGDRPPDQAGRTPGCIAPPGDHRGPAGHRASGRDDLSGRRRSGRVAGRWARSPLASRSGPGATSPRGDVASSPSRGSRGGVPRRSGRGRRCPMAKNASLPRHVRRSSRPGLMLRCGAEGGGRTLTGLTPQRCLRPPRLPFRHFGQPGLPVLNLPVDPPTG